MASKEDVQAMAGLGPRMHGNRGANAWAGAITIIPQWPHGAPTDAAASQQLSVPCIECGACKSHAWRTVSSCIAVEE